MYEISRYQLVSFLLRYDNIRFMIDLYKKESYTELPYSFLLTELRWKLNSA